MAALVSVQCAGCQDTGQGRKTNPRVSADSASGIVAAIELRAASRRVSWARLPPAPKIPGASGIETPFAGL
jgi:hypothetical protein